MLGLLQNFLWKTPRLRRSSTLLLTAVIGFASIFGGGAANAAGADLPRGCPDLNGHYRVDGFGPVLGDALKAMRAESAGFTDSEVRVASNADGSLGLYLKSGSTGSMSARPTTVLMHGVDFTCKNGWIILNRISHTSRKTEQSWLEGATTIRITRHSGGGLTFESIFSGSERNVIYSYDSAHLSLPKLGTGVTIKESIRWPDISEPAPVSAAKQPSREPEDVLKVRKILDSSVLGSVMLGGLRPERDGVLVTLNVPRSEDAVRLENRLRAASISYEMKVPPIWSNNHYHMEIMVWPSAVNTGKASRPSGYMVQQEVRKMQHPMVEVQSVMDTGDVYLVTLGIMGQDNIEGIIARIKANTAMFSEIVLINESVRADSPHLRLVHLRLRLR